MNPEQQRIALAEACGWSFIREGQSIERNHHIGCVTWVAISTDGRKYEYRKGYQEIEYLTKEDACNDRTPDYLNDLNAMHEAEKILDISTNQNTTGSYAAYAECLTWNGGYSATAKQRAEAFLRAIGKWTETNSIK
jgi:hypothetical protein